MRCKTILKGIGAFIIIVLFLSACSSRGLRQAKRSFDRGDYQEALQHAVQTYDKDKDEEARDMAYQSFIEGTRRWEAEIAALESEKDPLSEKQYDVYVKLYRLHHFMENSSLKSLPGIQGNHSIKTAHYTDAMREKAHSIAQARYTVGMEELNKGDALSARKAHGHFVRGLHFRDATLAKTYKELYTNLAVQRDKAKELGETTIVIATSDENTELITLLRSTLDKKDSWTTYTAAAGSDMAMRIWSAENWSAFGSKDAASISALYKSSHDIMVFLETTTATSAPVDKKSTGALQNGFKPTDNYSVGYERSYIISFQVYDLKSGESKASQRYTSNYTNTVRYSRLRSDKEEQLTFTTGPMSEETKTARYMVTNATEAQMNAMRSFLSTSFEKWTERRSKADIEKITSFEDLRSNYDEAFYAHTDLMTDGSTFRCANSGRGVSNTEGKKAGELYTAMRNNSLKLAKEALEDYSSDRAKAVQVIANWLDGKL